jgi:maleylacetoacetate isomerase
MKLYGYYRSSAAYRVRIALNLMGLDYEQIAVNLLEGEDQSGHYREINPQGLVPVLEVEGHRLSQSMAILEYLEESHPEPPLLPRDPLQRAAARSLANVIACDIHPLNNLRVLKYLQQELEVNDDARNQWYRHWIEEGFTAFEQRLEAYGSSDFCLGQQPGLADVLLIPQVYNARRFKVDMRRFPRIEQIEQHCLQLDPFIRAIPENQPDAPRFD